MTKKKITRIHIAKVTTNGQITIPKDLSEKLGITKTFRKVCIVEDKNGIHLQPGIDMMELAGKYPIPEGGPSIEKALGRFRA